MKRILLPTALIAVVAIFSYCNSAKKATASAKAPSFTWATHIEPLMISKCGPCHVAGKGNKLPLDNMDNVKSHIDDIIRRIQMQPGERGYMPFKNERLSDAEIAMVKTWKEENFSK